MVSRLARLYPITKSVSIGSIAIYHPSTDNATYDAFITGAYDNPVTVAAADDMALAVERAMKSVLLLADRLVGVETVVSAPIGEKRVIVRVDRVTTIHLFLSYGDGSLKSVTLSQGNAVGAWYLSEPESNLPARAFFLGREDSIAAAVRYLLAS